MTRKAIPKHEGPTQAYKDAECQIHGHRFGDSGSSYCFVCNRIVPERVRDICARYGHRIQPSGKCLFHGICGTEVNE